MMFTSRLRPSETRARRLRSANRARFTLEGLERRTVLSHMVVTPPAIVESSHANVGVVAKHADRLEISGLVVNNVALVNGQLVANAVLSGSVKNHPFAIPAAIPITLTATPVTTPAATTTAAAAPVSVLHLTLGPVNLSLLGLNVHLGGDCSFTSSKPITADIVAIPTGSTYTSPITGTTYQGGLLGDVLSGVANLLNNNGGSLGGLGGALNTLETDLTQLLNGLLGGAAGAIGGHFGAAGAATPAAGAANPPGTSDVLELPLGPISLDLLGALVQTSPICLHITATRGPGNLLGNLLG